MPLRMTKDSREQFLAEPRIGIVGIDEPGRSPRVVPLWYDFDPAVGVWIVSRTRSRKTALLREAGRYSLCVQDTAPWPTVMSACRADHRGAAVRTRTGFPAANPPLPGSRNGRRFRRGNLGRGPPDLRHAPRALGHGGLRGAV